MKKYRILAFSAVLLLSASLFTGCMMMSPVRTVTTVSYENPQWAPPYYSGARYYYVPDLELYYDLSAREFIFLMDGRWNFSPYLPAMYRNYDLNNSFCIVMNVNVYKPWLHHQYYVSHYPRYYYRDYYDRSNIPYVRAYNENLRRAVYWNEHERDRARPWNDENLRNNRRFKYSDEDRREQRNQTKQGTGTFGGGTRGERQNTNVQTRTSTQTETTTRPKTSTRTETAPQQRPETRPRTESTTQEETRTPATTRTTTTTSRQTSTNEEAAPVRNSRTNYYGRTIGTSVKVTKEMKERSATPSRTTTSTPTRNTRAASSGR